MKVKMNIKLIIVTTILAFVFFLIPKTAYASTLHLSPGGGNISIGGVTSVQVRLNAGGDSVNAVSAYLSYPADKLDVAWVSPGSAFSIEAEKSFGGGIIKISRGSFGGVSGNVNVATIGFRGKAAGQAGVSFIGGSAAPRLSDSSDSLNLGGSSGGVFNVGAGGGGTAPKTPADKRVDTPQSTVAELIINDIKATADSSRSATISWQTNGEADSTVEYGLEKDNYFLTETSNKTALNHSIKLENPFLTAGLKIHFRIRSKDAEGHEAVSQDQILQLLGYQVRVKVVDELGNPVSGVEVWLYSDPVKTTTDANGEAVFENIAPGAHIAVVKSADGDKSVEIQVSPDSAPSGIGQSQTGTASTAAIPGKPATLIKISRAAGQSIVKGNMQQILTVIMVIAIILAVSGMVIILKKRKMRNVPPVNNSS